MVWYCIFMSCSIGKGAPLPFNDREKGEEDWR